MCSSADTKKKRKRGKQEGEHTENVDEIEIERISRLMSKELGGALSMSVVRGVIDLHEQKSKWKIQMKCVVANVKDLSNPDFRRMIASGEISPKRIANMRTSEMASDKLKRERDVIEKRALLARLTDEQYRKAIGQEEVDGIECCGQCGSMKTDFVIVPISTEKDSVVNVSCRTCGFSWKID